MLPFLLLQAVACTGGERTPGEDEGTLGSGGDTTGSGGFAFPASGGTAPGSGGTAASGGANNGGTGGVATGGGMATGGSLGTGGVQDTFDENTGADCAIGSLPESGSLTTTSLLPDPFKRLDGSRITTKAEYRCRRAEIRKQAERYVFGSKPAPPNTVSGSVTNTSITVNVSDQGKNVSFSVGVELPTTGTAPYPVLISYGSGFFGFSQNAVVKTEGVAVIQFDPYAVGSESTARNNKSGAFYSLYGKDSSTGLLVAWAWGVSRILDVIASEGGSLLRVDAAAVAGCSRFGKGAFAAGAFDERIALTIPFESGTGGVPIWRGIQGEGAQGLGSAYGETYWFGDAFSAFTTAPTKLPIDTHSVIGMIAPRGLLILDNPHIANLGPRSAHVAALAGKEIYAALGYGDDISYYSNVASGTHCEARPEHVEPIKQSVRKFLLGTIDTPGAISAATKATGNLGQWRDWTTPKLD